MKLWRGQTESPFVKFTPTATERATAQAAMGGMILLLAWIEWVQPKAPPFTGKWAWLQSWAFETLGAQGLTVLYLIVGLILLLLSALTWWKR